MLEQAIQDLQRSGIAAADAERAQLFAVEDASTIYKDFKPVPALVIPYYQPDGQTLMTFDRDAQELPFCRVRYLDIPKPSGSFTGPQKAQRYAQPGLSGTRVYFCPLLPWATILADTREPIVITEGEKKALAGALAGMPVIGLGGVWNYGGGLMELLPELEAVKWRGRSVYIIFDSDAASNPNILAAEARLTYELGTKRGVNCYIVRLPQSDKDKVGLDDYLMTQGYEKLLELLQSTPPLSALDAKVLELNKEVAWIEFEGLVWDLKLQQWVKKENFVRGSRFSALKHVTMGGKKRTQAIAVSVPEVWLTHPHAQRYSEILFRPGADKTIQTPRGATALNFWDGWGEEQNVKTEDPRIQAFLTLNQHLFSKMEPAHRDLPLKLMIYKAQNPMSKFAMALVLIGTQGCGKSLWGECLAAAFAPYSKAAKSKNFGAEFQGWLERNVLVTVDEAEPAHLYEYGDQLKGLISGKLVGMNEKFRPERQIESYCFYVLTANDRAVGSYAGDDRRMVVVNCPGRMEDRSTYAYLGTQRGTWQAEGGAKALMGWMLNYDLKGWMPPAEAPETAEKIIAYHEGLTTVQELAHQMQTADESRIYQWMHSAKSWASEMEISGNPQVAGQARAIAASIDRMHVRDWYTSDELMMLFPTLVASQSNVKFQRITTSGQISRDLRNAGVPYLVCKDNPRGFKIGGVFKQFLVVAHFTEWENPISQADFERQMKNWPTFADITAARRNK